MDALKFVVSCMILCQLRIEPSQAQQTWEGFIKDYNAHSGERKPEFEMDRAWFTVRSSFNYDIEVWGQTTYCMGCALRRILRVRGPNISTILVDTRWPMKMRLTRQHPTNNNIEDICSLEKHFMEGGDYWVFVNSTSDHHPCDVIMANDPMPAEMPILFTILGLLGLAGLWAVMKCVYRNCRSDREKSADITNPEVHVELPENATSKTDSEAEKGVPAQHIPKPKAKQRLRSLDTFRGLSITVMIFVNYGGGGYWFFDHPPWNGLSVADLVFPWFIFIMGTAMTFSFRSMYKRGKTRCQMMYKITKRTCILFGLGIILASKLGPVDLTKLRIPGVLQRFALTYFCVATMELIFHRTKDTHKDSKWASVRDVVLYLPMWLINFTFVGVHLALTFGLHVPNCPTGYIGPGGLSENGSHYNCTGGAAGYIDRVVLGDEHLYHYPTPKELYETKVSYDPEGILGFLTSIFLCFLGLQAGRIISTYQTHTARVARFLVWGVIEGCIAALLCKGSQNDGWIPVNKNLWSLSFVLLTASFANLLLAVMYVFMDVLRWWAGSPFIYPGMNSIVLYCGHSMCYRLFPITWKVESVHWKLLLTDVWGVAVWCIIAYLMYRKRFFVAI